MGLAEKLWNGAKGVGYSALCGSAVSFAATTIPYMLISGKAEESYAKEDWAVFDRCTELVFGEKYQALRGIYVAGTFLVGAAVGYYAYKQAESAFIPENEKWWH